jgi:hypothetical protein
LISLPVLEGAANSGALSPTLTAEATKAHAARATPVINCRHRFICIVSPVVVDYDLQKSAQLDFFAASALM